MKINLQHIHLLLTAGLIIFLIIGRKPAAVPDRSGEIKALEKVSESIARERDTYRDWKDDLNRQLLKKDTLLQSQIKTQTKVIYEKIPAAVRNYSNDELRRAIENY